MYFGDAKKNCDALLTAVRNATENEVSEEAADTKVVEKKELPPPVRAEEIELALSEELAALEVSDITIGMVKEEDENEKRISVTPKSAAALRKSGFKVIVQSGAGMYSPLSPFTDEMYKR